MTVRKLHKWEINYKFCWETWNYETTKLSGRIILKYDLQESVDLIHLVQNRQQKTAIRVRVS
jgi:hypothetical protein